MSRLNSGKAKRFQVSYDKLNETSQDIRSKLHATELGHTQPGKNTKMHPMRWIHI